MTSGRPWRRGSGSRSTAPAPWRWGTRPSWVASTPGSAGSACTRPNCRAAPLEGLAPGLSPDWREGLLTREDWRIDAAATLGALRAAAESAGVTFHARAADGFEGGERLVIATGMGRDLGVIAPSLARLSPIKGHILRVGGTGLWRRGGAG